MSAPADPRAGDDADLAEFGYKQELDRTLGSFATFAAGISYISILTGTYPHSYAEPDRFLVRHVALDLTADFTEHRLEGSAELSVERMDPAARELQLDTRDLEIRSVQRLDAALRGHDLPFRLGARDPILGSA